MPESTSYAFKPDGGTLVAPFGQTDTRQARVIIEGVVTYAPTGERLDALYSTDASGAFSVPHPYLWWNADALVLEQSDPVRHRYVFRVSAPASEGHTAPVGVRWDVDRFVDKYLLPPSEIRANLSGAFTLTVETVPIAPTPVLPWPLVLAVGVPTALVMSGLTVVIQRRMKLQGLAPDLQMHLGQVEAKLKAARGALRAEDRRLVPIAERLTLLHTGTVALLRQLQDLRNAQRDSHRPRIEADVRMLERQIPTLSDAEARSEAQSALDGKRRTLCLLDEMANAESRCRMRLVKLEAVLDSTVISLRHTRTTIVRPVPATATEDALCRALDAEVSALGEVARAITRSDAADETQSLGLNARPN